MIRAWDRRLAILAGLMAVPYLVTGLMLVLYFQIDESLPRRLGILFALEYQTPLLWGAVPVALLWFVDATSGWRRRVGRIAFIGYVTAIATARAAQTVAVVQTRNFLDSEAFAHADVFEFVLTTRNVLVFLGVLLVPLLLVALLRFPRRPAKSPQRPEKPSHLLYSLLLLGSLGLSWFASHRAHTGHYLERFTNKHGIPHGPELALFQLLSGLDASDTETSETLSAETCDRLAAFGVIVHPEAEHPFRRDRVYDPAVTTPWTKFERPPDIVLFFVESLSAKLLGCYGTLPGDVTPWLDALAERSLKFDNYYNHATPTVCGLHGSLTSSYQISSYDSDANPEVRILAGARALSLAGILADRGYDTTYFGEGSRHGSHLGDMMANLGFRRQMFRDALAAEYPGITRQFELDHPDYRYGGHVSDILMCRYVQQFMAQPSRQPRLLCVSTIGMHFPYDYGEGVRYGDGKQPVLNSIHLLDQALAATTDYLRGGEREVLFVVTADHAMFPTIELVRIREKEFNLRLYDRIALIIHRSGSNQSVTIDTLSSSVDLLPTLLHLLNINPANPFMGWSIFAERRDYPRLLGSHHRHLFVKTAAGEWSPKLENIEAMPNIRLGNGRTFTGSHFREWLAYLRFQIRHNRIW